MTGPASLRTEIPWQPSGARGRAVRRSCAPFLIVLSAAGCGDGGEPAASCPVVGVSAGGGGPITYSGLTSGLNGTCVVASTGRVSCWEHGDQGEAAEVPDVGDALRVVVGPQRFCAIRGGGSVLCWSELGPREQVPGLCGATELAAGHLRVCAVVSGGDVACQGVSGGDSEAVPIPGVTGATGIALGRNGYTCVLLDDGSVTCWGGGPRPAERPGIELAPVPEISGAIAIAGSEAFEVCALLADRTVSCWSADEAPVPVEGLTQVAALAVGPRHGCAALIDGTVRCWGTNTYGELGDGTQTDSSAAVRVEQLEAVREVSVGHRVGVDMGYSCALQADGNVACWGAKTQVAPNGDWVASTTPVTMRLP